MDALELSIVTWLETFAADVRGKDYDHARKLFAEDVLAFGTRATKMTDLGQLEFHQWRPIWDKTTDFSFKRETLGIFSALLQHTVAVLWYSTGYDGTGAPFMRRGRATIVLKETDGKLQAVHCHFSLDPTPEALYRCPW
jgi:ketosteroid isomerase-like protein